MNAFSKNYLSHAREALTIPVLAEPPVCFEPPLRRPLVGVAFHGWHPVRAGFSGAVCKARRGGKWFVQQFRVVSVPAHSGLALGSIVTLPSLVEAGYAVKIAPVGHAPDELLGDDLILQMTLLALRDAVFEDDDLPTALKLAAGIRQQVAVRWRERQADNAENLKLEN